MKHAIDRKIKCKLKRHWVWCACVCMLAAIGWSPAVFGEQDLAFENHVRPILKAQCFHCHGEESELSGGLDVRLVRLMRDGGESGAAIVPGDVSGSLLWQRIESDEMPEGPKKLTPEQKAVIRRWIEQGANTARPEPANVQDARFSVEELSHWAFQPVVQPQVPSPIGYEKNTPIDGFIAAKLHEHGIPFSPVADRRVLIRRLAFNLHGLPPTPAEVERFVDDQSMDAYERLVDRLLASPRFGERWGRHWLDVAGFAETNGPQESDGDRPHVWRYRDYVIDAFNSSKPIDQFFIEQLAGDELIRGEVRLQNPQHMEWLAATGFLRMAPDRTRSENTIEERNAATAESMKVVSSALLGLTVGCAQCHDHKYDPIGTDDYYRFRAVFDPVFPLDSWRTPGTQIVDLTPADIIAEEARIEDRAKQLEDDIARRRNEHGQMIQERKLADVPEADRDATRTAVLTEAGKRTDEQVRLLKTYPMVKPVSTIAGGLLVEYDAPAYRKFEQENEQVAAIRATKPPRVIVSVAREEPGVVPVSHVMFRGNPQAPGDVVEPGELMVLSRSRDAIVPPKSDNLKTTGRRLAYARQLTDGTHPLAARVFVNRVWQHHFGQGLVATPGDFGIMGQRPTHPELLDWLASDFMSHGWDQKRLHRQILLSRTFQQTSKRTPKLNSVDPENNLLGRTNLRRLEAEAIRDSILAISQSLREETGGPSLPVVEAPDGKVTIGKATIRDGLKTGVRAVAGEGARRSIYVQVRRSLPLNVLVTFDLPDMNPNCELRRPSTVATQALWFLNDEQMVAHARRLAQDLMKVDDQTERVRLLFMRLFAAPPSASELEDCLQFLERQARHQADQAVQAGQADNVVHQVNKTQTSEFGESSLAVLCQTLLASNRFLYLD